VTPDEMIDRLGRIPAVLDTATRGALENSLLLIETDARQLAPRDVGRLGGSISHRITGEFPRLQGQVGPSVRYGAPTEFGRQAGARMPPVDALIPWVRRHWMPAIVSGQGVLPGFESEIGHRATNRRAAGRRVAEAQIRRRAFGLARAISRRGIRRRPYMSPAFHRNEHRIQLLFAGTGLAVVATLQGRQL
jgi:hypothetical protein